MTGIPIVTVEAAFGSDPWAASPTWTDLTSRVDQTVGITWGIRGRPDQYGQPQASTMSLTLKNHDGHLTAGNVSSPYYPDVVPGTRIRLSYVLPPGNLVTNPSFETDATGWSMQGGAGTIVREVASSWHGSARGKITWAAAGGGALYTVTTRPGRVYTASVYVLTASNPRVRLQVVGIASTADSVLSGSWQRLTFTFLATATSHQVFIKNVDTPTAGQISYVDALQVEEHSAATTFALPDTTVYRRWDGFVDEWPTTWGGLSTFSTVQITATDLLGSLAFTRKLHGVLQEEALYDDPRGQWPMGDDSESVVASDISGVAVPLGFRRAGVVGTYEFGAGKGPGNDQLSALVLTPTTAQGYYLAAVVSGIGESQTMELWFSTTRTGTNQGLMFLRDPISYFGVWMNSTGKIVTRSYPHGIADLTTANSYNDGLTHHVALTRSRAGDVFTTRLYVDGVQTNTSNTTLTGHAAYTPTAVYVGGMYPPTSWPPFAGTLSNAAVYTGALSATRVLAHYQAGATGGFAETSGVRIARWARYIGLPTALYNLDAGVGKMGPQQSSGQDALALMMDAARVENEALYPAGDGRLRLRARTVRYNAASLFTVAYGYCRNGLRFVMDKSGLVNHAAYTRTGGATAVRSDSTSITEHGERSEQLTLSCAMDDDAAAHAEWRVGTSATPMPRVSSVTVSLLNQPDAAVIQAVVAAEISSRFTVDQLPAQAPASSVPLFIEGIGETIAKDAWEVSFNTSSGSIGHDVLKLDDPVYGHLDQHRLAL